MRCYESMLLYNGRNLLELFLFKIHFTRGKQNKYIYFYYKGMYKARERCIKGYSKHNSKQEELE